LALDTRASGAISAGSEELFNNPLRPTHDGLL